MKKIVYSAIQPSGHLTIGNYLGSIINFKNLENEYDCFFNVADLHSITVPQDPKSIREKSLELIAIFLASGLDPIVKRCGGVAWASCSRPTTIRP